MNMMWFQANYKPHPFAVQSRELVEASGKALLASKQKH